MNRTEKRRECPHCGKLFHYLGIANHRSACRKKVSDPKKIADSDDMFEKKVFKIQRFFKHLTPARREILEERLRVVLERNKCVEASFDKGYSCDTCGATDGKEHPHTGYCFYCDTDNWRGEYPR